MIKLFEPFRPKIQLHIRQDFLRELWDKYVPVSSESYDHISLVYLKGITGEADKGTKQVQVLVDLILRNINLQINMSRNPMLVTRKVVNNSLRYTLKHYLTQLKRTDLRTFQDLNQYVTYLRQAEAENKRFESWRSDSQVLRQMEKEYHILQRFSQNLRELSSVRSFEIERRLGNELLRSMKKTEYRIFAKNMVWQERQQIAEYIRNCENTEYRQIVERLVSEPELKAVWDKENFISKGFLLERIEKYFGQEELWKFYHKVLFPKKDRYKEVITFSEEVIYDEKNLIAEADMHGEENIVLEQDTGSEKVYRFHKGILIWEKNRKGMVQYLEQLSGEKVHYFWERIQDRVAEILDRQESEFLREKAEPETEDPESLNVYRMFYAKLEKMQKDYLLEISESLRDIVEETQKQDGAEILTHIMNLRTLLRNSESPVELEKVVTTVEEAENEHLIKKTADQEPEDGQIRSLAIQSFQNVVHRIERNVEYSLQEQKNRIVKREIDVLNRYQDILRTKGTIWESLWQEEAEKEFLLKYKELPLSEKAVQKLWSWSKALLVDPEYRSEDHTVQKQQENTETVRQDAVHESERNMDIADEKVVSERNMDIAEEKVVSNESVAIEYRTEYQKLIKRLNDYGKQYSFHIEYRENSIINEQVQELIMQTRKLEPEQYSSFIRVFSDMIQVRRRKIREDTAISRQILRQMESYDTEVEKIFHTYYGVQLDEKAVRKLQDWSEALQEGSRLILADHTVTEFQEDQEIVLQNLDEGMTIEERTEFQKLIEQLDQYGKHRSFHIEYIESSLTNAVIQELITYVRNLDSEQYSLFIKALTNMTEARQVVQEWKMRDLAQASGQDSSAVQALDLEEKKENAAIPHSEVSYDDEVEKIFRIYYGVQLDKEAVRRLQLWSKTLQESGMSALQELPVTESQKNPEQEMVLRNLIGQMNEYGQKNAFHIEYIERSLTNKSVQESRYLEVEKVFRSNYGTQLTTEAIRELVDWSEALQESGRPGRQEKEEFLSEDSRKSKELMEGDMQTEIIRQHIQQAKDRMELHQLVEQVNHYAGEAVKLEYREEQLYNPSIQKLIWYIRQLDEEHHRIFVEQLSKMIEVQQSMQAWENADTNMYNLPEENTVHRVQRDTAGPDKELRSRNKKLLVQEKSLPDLKKQLSVQEKSLPDLKKQLSAQEKSLLDLKDQLTVQAGNQSGWKPRSANSENHSSAQTLRFSNRISQRVYEIYPELSHRIQEYEAWRKERYEKEIRQLMVNRPGNVFLYRPLRLNTTSDYTAEKKKVQERDLTGWNQENIQTAYQTEWNQENIQAAYQTERNQENIKVPYQIEWNQKSNLIPEHHPYESQQELKHAAPGGQTQPLQQDQAGRIQEERIQMKSVQAQMDVRLKQVEQQLKQVEIRAGQKENVRETAEKIKKLLHEELHLEKLRRGMT